MWFLQLIVVLVTGVAVYVYKHRTVIETFFSQTKNGTKTILTELAVLDERTKYLQGLDLR